MEKKQHIEPKQRIDRSARNEKKGLLSYQVTLLTSTLLRYMLHCTVWRRVPGSSPFKHVCQQACVTLDTQSSVGEESTTEVPERMWCAGGGRGSLSYLVIRIFSGSSQGRTDGPPLIFLNYADEESGSLKFFIWIRAHFPRLNDFGHLVLV